MKRTTTIERADGTMVTVRYRRWLNHPAPGVDFPDMSPLATDGTAIGQIIDALAERLPADTDVVAGIDIGGLAPAGALAYRNALGLLDIRKVGSMRVEVIRTIMANYELGDGVAISRAIRIAGRAVTIIDDCLMTGETALAAVKLIRRLGGRCDAAMFVFELEGMGGRALLQAAGVGVHSLRRLPPTEPESPSGEDAGGSATEA